jgi:asparagine synthase (glutamine-hydrolysing)
MANVLIVEEYQWRKISQNKIDIFFKGDLSAECLDDLFSLVLKDEVFISQYINTLDINFAIVISTKDLCILAVDKVRSIPIIYTNIKDEWCVDCNSSRILSLMGDEKEVNERSALSIAMSGYTIGDETLYESINALVAGQLVILKNLGGINKIQYYQYIPREEFDHKKNYKYELAQTTLNILQKTIDSLNGRQAVIPLSAGNDSRLIASGFKHLGYKNVKCYSYGFSDFESDTSKIISEKLGYEWKLVELDGNKERQFYKSEEFKEYLCFSDTLTSIPVVRWLSTVRVLKESGWIDKDAVFINGNSGDFISGGHINSKIYRENNSDLMSSKNDVKHMLCSFMDKHYKLWGRLYNKQNKTIIKKLLLHEYKNLLESDDAISIESAYESIEYFHRQSKYVISAQRVYEYYGYEWRLPLWDVDYLEFWSKIPVNLKYGQKLYKDMLLHENWAGVWEIPVNDTNVRPKWIIPLRLFFKFIFFIVGNKKTHWHQFEISVFKYWMDNGKVTMLFPYTEFLFNHDIRGVQALISRKYLRDKKIFFLL